MPPSSSPPGAEEGEDEVNIPDEAKCNICTETYTEVGGGVVPIMGPCGHTYCENCLATKQFHDEEDLAEKKKNKSLYVKCPNNCRLHFTETTKRINFKVIELTKVCTQLCTNNAAFKRANAELKRKLEVAEKRNAAREQVWDSVCTDVEDFTAITPDRMEPSSSSTAAAAAPAAQDTKRKKPPPPNQPNLGAGVPPAAGRTSDSRRLPPPPPTMQGALSREHSFHRSRTKQTLKPPLVSRETSVTTSSSHTNMNMVSSHSMPSSTTGNEESTESAAVVHASRTGYGIFGATRPSAARKRDHVPEHRNDQERDPPVYLRSKSTKRSRIAGPRASPVITLQWRNRQLFNGNAVSTLKEKFRRSIADKNRQALCCGALANKGGPSHAGASQNVYLRIGPKGSNTVFSLFMERRSRSDDKFMGLEYCGEYRIRDPDIKKWESPTLIDNMLPIDRMFDLERALQIPYNNRTDQDRELIRKRKNDPYIKLIQEIERSLNVEDEDCNDVDRYYRRLVSGKRRKRLETDDSSGNSLSTSSQDEAEKWRESPADFEGRRAVARTARAKALGFDPSFDEYDHQLARIHVSMVEFHTSVAIEFVGYDEEVYKLLSDEAVNTTADRVSKQREVIEIE